jgi:hypothetical protein
VYTAAAMKVPQPLDCNEIKDGIVAQIRAEGVPENVCAIIRAGLNRTCSLNRQSYSKFSVKWFIREGLWRVEYELDDFGRLTAGVIGGEIAEKSLDFEGNIDPMPPDAFRRRTEQPIPQPRTVAPKKDDGVGMSMAQKSAGRRKMT